MYAVRRWSVRNARPLESIYAVFEPVLVRLHPLWRAVGYRRMERPTAAVERVIKGFFFDCKMCGQCVLSDTGLSCPMNCPKQLRNGPCGGVRDDGSCEVEPDMHCVWVDAYDGSRRMRNGGGIEKVQVAVDFSLWGRSSWLKVARDKHDQRVALKETKA